MMRWVKQVLQLGAVAAVMAPPILAQAATQTATFAGGCFWCVESDFEKVPGVVSAVSGYTGGRTSKPTYETAAADGHIEAVKVTFDTDKVSYTQLLDFYWRHVDVLDGGGQFCDRGNGYRPVIYVDGAEQAKEAEASKAALVASKRFSQPIAVTIEPVRAFTLAEDYHQDYYKKSAIKYKFYRYNCGRDARIKALWGNDGATH
jgi:methionine-S-sulfoxide reductase